MNPAQVIISWEQWVEYQDRLKTPKQKESEYAQLIALKLEEMKNRDLLKTFTIDELIKILQGI